MDVLLGIFVLMVLAAAVGYAVIMIITSPTFWAILGAVAVLGAVDYYGGLGLIPW